MLPPCRGPLRHRLAKEPEIERVGAGSGVGDRGEQPRKTIRPVRNHMKRNAVLSDLFRHATEVMADPAENPISEGEKCEATMPPT